jgi:hypothetical protein
VIPLEEQPSAQNSAQSRYTLNLNSTTSPSAMT